MSVVTFYGGGLEHFVDHLAPIYKALPEKYRGPFHARRRGRERAAELGIDAIPHPPKKADLVVVASYEDYRAVHPCLVALVNHGVGQTYLDGRGERHPSYSGGRDRERVLLNLCPSERDAEINRAAYPQAKSVAVGVPKLDLWHPPEDFIPPDGPVVAVSFHADVHVVPESRWSFPHYQDVLPFLKDHFVVLGHAHPRMRTFMQMHWKKMGIPFEPHFSQVLYKADIYVCDNSSTLYEFASTGRPVVVLNAPWYRRDIHHGLRFWDTIPGIEVDEPAQLLPAIQEALRDPPELRKKREDALAVAYSGVQLDGKATERAVEAILELVN